MNDAGRLAAQATSCARENLLRTRILLRSPKCNQVKSGFAQIVRWMRCAWDDPPDLNCRAKSYSAADHLITPGASKKTFWRRCQNPFILQCRNGGFQLSEKTWFWAYILSSQNLTN